MSSSDSPKGTSPKLSLPAGVEPYFEKDGCLIINADCREILPTLDPVDLVLTDPPYGINADRARNCRANGWNDYAGGGWDNARPDTALLLAVVAAGREAVVWGGNYFADALPPSMRWLVWDKGQRDFDLADGELAWTSQQKAMRIFNLPRSAALRDGKQHATQKPVALMKWCIDFFPDAVTILDPFMGSGTTLVAARDMGRKCIGIEIEERYCEIAANRLAQGVLFGAHH